MNLAVVVTTAGAADVCRADRRGQKQKTERCRRHGHRRSDPPGAGG